MVSINYGINVMHFFTLFQRNSSSGTMVDWEIWRNTNDSVHPFTIYRKSKCRCTCITRRATGSRVRGTSTACTRNSATRSASSGYRTKNSLTSIFYGRTTEGHCSTTRSSVWWKNTQTEKVELLTRIMRLEKLANYIAVEQKIDIYHLAIN